MAAVRRTRSSGIDLFKPRDERKRHRLEAMEPARKISSEVLSRSHGAASAVRRRAWLSTRSRGTAAPTASAMPLGSRIMITRRRPGWCCRRGACPAGSAPRLDDDFLGVKTRSTMMPKVLAADLGDDTKRSWGVPSLEIQQHVAGKPAATAGHAGAEPAMSLIRSMRCSDGRHTPTSSTTCSCGMAKRCSRRPPRSGRKRSPRSAES